MSIVLSGSGQRLSQEKKTPQQDLPPLPDIEGRAGMLAGVSHGTLICMGGANFPNGYPWQGGKKKWYDDIYLFDPQKNYWQHLRGSLPCEMGYGVSASYEEKIWVVGGSNAQGHLSTTWSAEYHQGQVKWKQYPSLPHSLANMSGTVVGSLLIIVGGMETADSLATKSCYGLDLNSPDKGWSPLPAWPGPERIFPVCGAYQGKFYMFSGENTAENSLRIKQRNILHDAYCFYPRKEGNIWTGEWSRLGDIPRGLSAGASPAPLVARDKFRLWGGVDRITALHVDPMTHPGIPSTVLLYSTETDTWEYDLENSNQKGRVTLPVVLFKNKFYYISGELKPGVRDNSILMVQ